MSRTSAVAVTLLLLAAAGCGSGGDSVLVNGPFSPLGAPGPGTEVCGPDATGENLTAGGEILQNQSTGAVTIEQVSFYGDHHMRLIGAVVAPDPGAQIGIAGGWPPSRTSLAQSGVEWRKREPAAGATVPPGRSPTDRRNLIIGMRPTAYRSVVDGLVIRYREHGRQYELRTHNKSVIYIAKSAPGNCI